MFFFVCALNVVFNQPCIKYVVMILSCNSCYMWDRRFSLKQQEAHQRKDCRSLRQGSLRGAIVLLKIFHNLFWKCLFLCVIVLLKSKCICFYKCAILTATFIAILVFQIKTEIYIHLVWFEQMANCTNFIFPLLHQKEFGNLLFANIKGVFSWAKRFQNLEIEMLVERNIYKDNLG